MHWKNVKLIFAREVRDQLRDRRTLFMVAVLPLLLYPLLGVAMVQMTHTFSEQERTVVVLGAEHLPDVPLIRGERFVDDYFDVPGDAEKLRVVTDANDDHGELDDSLRDFLQEAQRWRDEIQELARLTERRRDAEEAGRDDLAEQIAAEEELHRGAIAEWFNRSDVQVLILIPEGYRDRLEQLDRQLASREADLSGLDVGPRPVILENAADEKSAIAFRRVWQALRNWEQELLDRRLRSAGLPETLPAPFDATDVDLAEENQLAANVWSKLFPTLLVLMAVTGAFYPAIDVGAGEKERGTMETLLICPATRAEIVTGKFLTVMGFSLTTALLNLVSMGLTGKYMLEMAGSGARLSQFGNVAFPPPSALLWVIVLAVPLAALFSALSLAFAMFARSSKEGQYYLTPLLMVALGLTLVCLNPAVELNAYYSVLPVMGPSLLLKSLLLGPANPAEPMKFLAPVLLSSCGYCVLALWWAIELFKREDVLFREAERFDLGLWVRHILRDKEPTPSFVEAGFCFVMILLLQFLSLRTMLHAFGSTADGMSATRLLQVQTIYLVATVATPALFMALLLTTDFVRTLKLRPPSPSMLGTGPLLALVLLPLTQELMHWLGPFFPDLPPGVAELLATMGSEQLPLWLPLTAFALAPAVCEELAFRGFILTGMQRSGRPWLPIVLSSVAFGTIHMIPQQVFNAFLLGLVLGLLAVRSGSLWPAVLFHLVFNGMQVLAARYSDVIARLTEQPGWRWLLSIETIEGQPVLRFQPLLLLICAVIAAAVIRRLAQDVRKSTRSSKETGVSETAVEQPAQAPMRVT